MKDLYRNAGERIKKIRLSKGLTREKLAESSNISSKFLYEVESGKKGFSAENLFNICAALNVKTDYILTGADMQCKDL